MKNPSIGVGIMLKNIINELKNTEQEAEKIIENAEITAQKMIKEERDAQEKIKNKSIHDWNQKGRNMVENRIKKAQQQALEIHDSSEKEIESLRKNSAKKYEQAIKMILEYLVNEYGNISDK